jgi:hypothetical protein
MTPAAPGGSGSSRPGGGWLALPAPGSEGNDGHVGEARGPAVFRQPSPLPGVVPVLHGLRSLLRGRTAVTGVRRPAPCSARVDNPMSSSHGPLSVL